jgi:hypothetical protein
MAKSDRRNATQKTELKIEHHEPNQKPGMNSGASRGKTVRETPVLLLLLQGTVVVVIVW